MRLTLTLSLLVSSTIFSSAQVLTAPSSTSTTRPSPTYDPLCTPPAYACPSGLSCSGIPGCIMSNCPGQCRRRTSPTIETAPTTI
ncbi:hypothetical protein HBI56_054260 [Parastagonospora nodorum]|uniref:WAP domain-containing protein n=1 Tax=Phaeosphaeria nodorum (strain SN15 / ATCC MYA-4574 / FGSC 10173) TaxID=321614 RepID=A0A7U2ICM9_PHANO|nr:hypothetical protein HBH56_097860 [Parastagonospora nodorum]QRD07343.1 hypothetical protein JI435_447320 [Parastagonospora nodorum SN15]KAH3930327.1 hypothetical protein HBH54_112180 [Parastagonospora nodorum]KAH3945026.1 hypothetical protein HBH53_147260 [Parastagonospora nodorum]KAH3966862.1 hypothetical protein HBH51_138660 [Parastagonospora nodorum]